MRKSRKILQTIFSRRIFRYIRAKFFSNGEPLYELRPYSFASFQPILSDVRFFPLSPNRNIRQLNRPLRPKVLPDIFRDIFDFCFRVPSSVLSFYQASGNRR